VPIRLEAAAAIAGRTAPLDGAAFVDARVTHMKFRRQYTTAPVSGSKSNREVIPAQGIWLAAVAEAMRRICH
jgi:hypothetical protein